MGAESMEQRAHGTARKQPQGHWGGGSAEHKHVGEKPVEKNEKNAEGRVILTAATRFGSKAVLANLKKTEENNVRSRTENGTAFRAGR